MRCSRGQWNITSQATKASGLNYDKATTQNHKQMTVCEGVSEFEN